MTRGWLLAIAALVVAAVVLVALLVGPFAIGGTRIVGQDPRCTDSSSPYCRGYLNDDFYELRIPMPAGSWTVQSVRAYLWADPNDPWRAQTVTLSVDCLAPNGARVGSPGRTISLPRDAPPAWYTFDTEDFPVQGDTECSLRADSIGWFYWFRGLDGLRGAFSIDGAPEAPESPGTPPDEEQPPPIGPGPDGINGTEDDVFGNKTVPDTPGPEVPLLVGLLSAVVLTIRVAERRRRP